MTLIVSRKVSDTNGFLWFELSMRERGKDQRKAKDKLSYVVHHMDGLID